MINHFTFNGTSTAQLGLIVSGVSIFGAGSRKVEKARIPGRNGDLQIELGGFNNYTVRYTVSITKNFTTTAQQIREWLLESKGYCELTDTYHPDEIRKACFNSDIEFTTSMLYKYGQASIQFDCLPERYLTTNTPITTTATADTTTDTTMSLSTVPTPLNISLNGNTTQEGSSGKNLQDLSLKNYQTSIESNGVTLDYNATKFRLHGTATASGGRTGYALLSVPLTRGTYTISAQNITGTIGQLYGFLQNSSNTVIGSAFGFTGVATSTTVTVSASDNYYIGFNVTSGDTYDVYFNIQLEQGSTATAYEPHISPTNPQVIHSVSGDNEVVVCGKNVLGLDLFVDETFYNVNENGSITVKLSDSRRWATVPTTPTLPQGTYTFSRELGYGLCDIRLEYENYGTAHLVANTVKTYTFTLTQPSKIKMKLGYSYSSYPFTETVQLEQGTSRTDFEPYTRQSYPLYLPVENLNKIADVKSGWLPTTGAYPTTNGSYPNAQYLIVPLNKGETCYLSGTTNIKGRVRAMNTSAVIGTVTANTTDYTTTADQSSGFKEGSITALQDLLLGILFMDGYASSGGNELIIAKGTNIQNYAIELNKIGTYQDYIYKNGGKWYVHKAITKVDLGTLDSWNSYNDTFYANLVGAIIPSSGIASILCTSYRATSMASVISKLEDKAIALNTGQSRCNVYDSSYNASTIGNFINSVKGVWLYYPLSTPTNTEITDTTLINQLNNIEKAYSYNGTTNILQVSNDNGFMLEVVSLHGSTFNSNYKGEPIITVNATGLIYLNGEVMEVLSAPVTINCQTMQCYNGVVNMNNEVRVNDFPEIKIGSNEVGSSMALTITPNNWRH